MMNEIAWTMSPAAFDLTLVMHCGSVRAMKVLAIRGAERRVQRGVEILLVDQAHLDVGIAG